MTNDELRADLLADPETPEIAKEQGMTVEAYVAATLAYCDAPEAGFAGCGIEGPDHERSEEEQPAPSSAFEASRPSPPLLNAEPGRGITCVLPSMRVNPSQFRG